MYSSLWTYIVTLRYKISLVICKNLSYDCTTMYLTNVGKLAMVPMFTRGTWSSLLKYVLWFEYERTISASFNCSVSSTMYKLCRSAIVAAPNGVFKILLPKFIIPCRLSTLGSIRRKYENLYSRVSNRVSICLSLETEVNYFFWLWTNIISPLKVEVSFS